MRTLSLLAGAAALALATPAFAQDAPLPLPDTGVQAEPPAVGTARVIQAINASQMVARDIQNLPAVDQVAVVEINASGATEAEMIRTALVTNASGIEALRGTLESDSTVSAALDAHGIDTMQIVAADVDARGNVTIYTYRG